MGGVAISLLPPPSMRARLPCRGADFLTGDKDKLISSSSNIFTMKKKERIESQNIFIHIKIYIYVLCRMTDRLTDKNEYTLDVNWQRASSSKMSVVYLIKSRETNDSTFLTDRRTFELQNCALFFSQEA